LDVRTRIWKIRVTGVAGVKLAFPACVAVMLTSPTPIGVAIALERVTGPKFSV
jgi:hypothetical protein